MSTVYLTIEPTRQTVSHIWKTGSTRALDGTPQRSALFGWPRIALSQDFDIIDRAQEAWFRRNFYRNIHELWAIPIWPDKGILTEDAAMFGAEADIGSTASRHLYPGRKVIFLNPDDWTDYQVHTIDHVTDTSIFIDGTFSMTVPAGHLAMPLYECRITSKQEITPVDYESFAIQVEGMEAYETLRTFSWSPAASGAPTYFGHDVFLPSPQADSLRYTFNRPYDLAQWIGLGYAESLMDDTMMSIDAEYLFKDRESCWDLLRFFDSKMGRLSPFWAPSWNRDLVPTAAIPAAATVIQVENFQYNTFWAQNDVIGKYLFFEFPDKTWAIRQVTGASDTSVTLDSQVGTAVPAADLSRLRCCFAHFVTFAIDRLDMAYEKTETAMVKCSFDVLIKEIP